MTYGKLTLAAAALAALAALAAGPAAAQERQAFEDGYRFADVLQHIKDVAAMPLHERPSRRLVRGMERPVYVMTADEINGFARWLGEAIVSDASMSAEARYLAARWLAYNAAWSREERVLYPGPFDALRTVFEQVEPTALCWRDVGWLYAEYPDGDRCKRDPLRTAWCVAGHVLHGEEVGEAMGLDPSSFRHLPGGSDLFTPVSEPPEVAGPLSDAAAFWWSRCWNGRASPERPAW